jgi:hypothetical protein
MVWVKRLTTDPLARTPTARSVSAGEPAVDADLQRTKANLMWRITSALGRSSAGKFDRHRDVSERLECQP